MSRYKKYAGGDPLAPPVDIAEALDAIGEDVMSGYSPERAMREFLRRGGQDQRGLDDLARQVAERRRELLQRHNLDGTLEQVRELLDKAVLEERKQLARDVTMDDGDRAFREMQIDNLSPNTAAAVSELSSYDWASREAREAYEEIKDLLGREILDQRFAGMKQALEGATDEDREAIAEMLRDLNQLLDKHNRGEDTEADFDEFMAKHGQYFPENPQNIDELLDTLAQRSAAAQRMLNSMSAEQRRELMELSAQAFGSPALMEQMAQLDANLQAAGPARTGTAPRSSAAARASASATAPACCRTSPSSTSSPSSSSSPTPGAGSTTSTSTRSPGSSASRPRSMRAPCRSSSRRCATPASSNAARTATCG